MADTRLLTTSVIRMSRPNETSGYVRLVNRQQKQSVAQWPIPESPFREYDLNPRGGLRGGRGLGGNEERLVIAITDRLFVFDRSWHPVGELTHPMFGEIHDVLVEADGVWVTSSSSDMLVKLGWDGKVLRQWSFRDDPALAASLKLEGALAFDPSLDYRDPRQLPAAFDFVHLNSVFRTPSGLLLSFGYVMSDKQIRIQRAFGLPGSFLRWLGFESRKLHPSQLFELRFLSARHATSSWAAVLLPDEGPARLITLVHGVKFPNHNAVQHGPSLVYNDTNRSQLVQQSFDGSWKKQIRIPGKPAFARGLAALGRNRFVVGSQQPTALYEVDLDAMKVERLVELGTHVHESVFGIHVLPDGFNDPPERLW